MSGQADIKRALQTAYYTLLDGNVTLNGETVPVYDVMSIPGKPNYPYIALGDFTATDWSDKTSFGETLTFTVTVYDRSDQIASRGKMYDVIDQIKRIIRARPVPFNLTNWNVLTSVLDDENFIPKLLEGTHTYFGTQLRFRHVVEYTPPPSFLIDAGGNTLTDNEGIALI